MDLDRNVWEGWTPRKFIEEILPVADMIMRNEASTKPFKNKSELEKWLKDAQPYYKKKIPEVNKFFYDRYKQFLKG